MKEKCNAFGEFNYKGFDIPAGKISENLFKSYGIYRDYFNDNDVLLRKETSPLSSTVALYLIGRDISLGKCDLEGVPENIIDAGKKLYEILQEKKDIDIWHNDFVQLFENKKAPKRMKPPNEKYRLAQYHKNSCRIGSHKYTDKKTETTTLWLPPVGYIVPTNDGTYHPVTGIPFETINNRNSALDRWVEKFGLEKERADKEISTFHICKSGQEFESYLYNVRTCSNESDGPFSIKIGHFPDTFDELFFFPIRRLSPIDKYKMRRK